MKKSLCIDARMLFSSGIGTYLSNLIPLIESAFETTLLIKSSDMEEAKQRFSSRIIRVDAPIYSVREQIILPFVIPSCDLFWSPHYNIPLLPIKAKKRVVTIHDICHLALPQFFSKIKKIPAHFLLKRAVQRSNLVLTVSNFSKKEIERVLFPSEDRVCVVLNGVEKKKRIGESFSEKAYLKNPYILYVGNLKPHKNIDRLIEACLLLPSCYDLVLAGRLFYSSSMKKDYLKHPRIHLLGEVSEGELSFLYQKAEALIQPSLYEGFGLTPLEAMNFGCPVVSSTAEGLKETCGPAAYYVDPLSVEAMHKGIEEVLENQILRDRLIRAGFQRKDCFSWKRSADQLIELFQKESSL